MTNKNYEIVDKFQDKILVKCQVCGRLDIKKQDELDAYTCATCNKFSVSNINKDSEYLSKIMQGTEQDSKNNRIQCNKHYFSNTVQSHDAIWVANKLSERFEIIGSLYQRKKNKYNVDEIYTETDTVVCKCKNCGTVKLVRSDQITNFDAIYCNLCKNGYNTKNNTDVQNTWDKMKSVISSIVNKAENRTHIKENYNTRLFDKKQAIRMKAKYTDSEREIQTVSYKVGEKMKKAFEKVKALNPDFEIEGFTVNGAEYTVKCSCTKCGNDVSIPSSLKKKQVECQGCKELRINPNYRGVYLKNNVNICKNNMIVTKDFGRKVEVTCRLCSTKYTVSKYDWMYGNIYCDVDHDLLDMTIICDKCGNYPELKTSELIKYKGDGTEPIICNCCKNPVMHTDENGDKKYLTFGDMIADMSGTDSKTTRSRNFGIAIKELKSTTSTINSLCRSNTVLYVDAKGERYYNCRCLEHNQNMILTDNEIDNFNHSQCNDVRNLVIQDSMIENIKIR
jgi:hypothetical protein